jgi:hypothetical protein
MLLEEPPWATEEVPTPVSLPTRSAATCIETDRLLLRAYQPGHFGPFFELMADPETFRFSERGAMTSDEAWSRLLRHIGQWSVTGYGFFAVEEKAAGSLAKPVSPISAGNSAPDSTGRRKQAGRSRRRRRGAVMQPKLPEQR